MGGSDMRIGFRAVEGVQIRFAVGDSPTSPRLVLTSPWPESLLAFQRVWSRLSRTAHVLAIDLPGFGRSERRTELLSPLSMSEFLVRLLDQWDIDQPHLVCPDIGTPAALYAAANHPGRMRSLVVGSGASAYPLVVEDYIESTRGDRFAQATRYVRSYPEQLQRLGGILPTIYTPVQIIAGRWDPLVPLANADHLHAHLPNSRLDVLDTGHFTWEQAPEQYAAIVTAWVNGGYLAGSAAHQW